MEKSKKEFIINEITYTNIVKIYDGDYSKVYLGEDQKTKKKYAIKILKPESDLKKEVSILIKVSALNNPYIINLITYGEGHIKKNKKNSFEEKKYVVLEYALKGDIFDYINKANNGLEEIYAKFIFKKILDGVQAIHEAGICHRDLKMTNILMDEFFNPKICDFGFATETQDENGPKLLTEYLGTPNYAAPEMYEGKPYDGVKADIFSLGVILLNLVTSNIGFKDAKEEDKYYINIKKKKYDKYWEEVENEIGTVPDQVKNLYIKMVAYEPSERPSIKEILGDPWMKQIKDLDKEGEEYKTLENEVFKKFKELENQIHNGNETVDTNNNFNEKIDLEKNKGLSDDEFEKRYFNLDLPPKYILKTGLNMKHYIKINGDLNPTGFMNSFANEIKKKYGEKCEIKENELKLKFNAIFENSEKNQNEENEELKEGKENSNDDEIVIKRKESIIQIKLFESANGGYVVRFNRNQGEIEDYHKHLNNLKKIIKNLL